MSFYQEWPFLKAISPANHESPGPPSLPPCSSQKQKYSELLRQTSCRSYASAPCRSKSTACQGAQVQKGSAAANETWVSWQMPSQLKGPFYGCKKPCGCGQAKQLPFCQEGHNISLPQKGFGSYRFNAPLEDPMHQHREQAQKL